MSFVLLEDDEDPQATMQEAFAMIDACDELRQSGGSVRSSETNESICVTPEMQQQRVEAELLNMSLKKALTAEKKWSKSLQSVLDKRQSMETVSLASSMLLSSTPSSMHCSPAVLRDDPVAVRREIMTLMDKMYHEAKATVDPVTGRQHRYQLLLATTTSDWTQSRPNDATDVGNATKLQLRFI
ncbi:hypothetical protein GQ600_17621 [Phytophthora cactorum]|nr:hypothetical protein GQ600_17621 [Phytophthora cactorum]